MSATDSDNSIDWLASDTEGNESEQEPECSAKRNQREAPLSEGSSELREGNWCEVSGSRVSPGCPARSERDSGNGLCKSQRGEKANSKNTQAAKRPLSSTGEQCKEQQLISDALEKDQVFINKVSTPVTFALFSHWRWTTVSAKLGHSLPPRSPHPPTPFAAFTDISSKAVSPLFFFGLRSVCHFDLRKLCHLIINQALLVSYLQYITQ